jgi:DNA-binding phage protein
MSERIPVYEVKPVPCYRADGLTCEESISGYMECYAEDGAVGVLHALPTVALARLFNQMAPATGIDRRRLCGALDGGPPLTEEEANKILDYFNVCVPMETSVAVG